MIDLKTYLQYGYENKYNVTDIRRKNDQYIIIIDDDYSAIVNFFNKYESKYMLEVNNQSGFHAIYINMTEFEDVEAYYNQDMNTQKIDEEIDEVINKLGEIASKYDISIEHHITWDFLGQ